MISLPAFAHSNDTPNFTQVTETPESWQFIFDPTLIFFLLLAVFYLLSLRSFKKKPVSTWQIIVFLIGIVIQFIVLNPVSDSLASQLFFMHMIQHLAIILLAVPCILVGGPFFVLIRALPPKLRRWLYLPMIRS
ncbi:MAG: cytochrome c oxidase assembly protein, partial [Proteobacteria bacterium]|nr:cytochrome c oxidase assembly protein [Pseudomonadota bacterium]